VLLNQDGVAGTRQRLDEIEDRRRALTALNEQEFAGNPARLRAHRTAIETDSAQSRAAVKTEAHGLYADLRRYLTTGGPGGGRAVALPPSTLMSRFTDGQQASIARQVDRAVEGRPPTTDPQTWYTIRHGLTDNDADERERWASTNLVPFMDRLSDEDYAALSKLQMVVRTNDGGAETTRFQIINRMANEALRTAGIDPTPRLDAPPDIDAAQAATFHRALQGELSAFESSKGRKPTAAEAYDIVNGLKDTGIESGWLKVSNPHTTPTVASDIPLVDDAVHEPGAQLAEAEPSAEPAQHEFRIIGPAEDFETFHRQMEEYRQREAADTGGSNGAPATEPDPGSPEYQAADTQARQIVAEQEDEGSRGQGMAPATEPPPGNPEYQAAEAEARKLDEGAWENLGFFGQLGVAFKRFDAESRKSGAALAIDSNARRQEKVLELQRKAKETPDELDLVEKQYLLRNRNVASDLAGAVVRLIDAQRRLDELPSSDPLRRLSEASTPAEAGKLLRDHPGEIARAIGLESLPSLTISLIATAALGPIGSAVALTGTSGLEGYANGLVGALSLAGVDVSDADALISALQDNALMERIRKDATTDGAVAVGINIIAMAVPVRIRLPVKRASLTWTKVPEVNVRGMGFKTFPRFKGAIGHAPEGYEWHHIVPQTGKNIEKFTAPAIHNTNNLVLLPKDLHTQISAHYASKQISADNILVRDWLGKMSFDEQAAYGRQVLEDFRRAMK
jgi:hypothetical protein